MEKTIVCCVCKRQIQSKEDLVVSLNGIVYADAFCHECYAQRSKSLASLFMGDMIINSAYMNLLLVFAFVVVVLLMFFDPRASIPVFLVLVIASSYRLYSYAKYERWLY